MPQQILIIHGGDTWDSYEEYLNFIKGYDLCKDDLTGKKKWKNHLQEDLGDDFEVMMPTMPCAWNAKYFEWKIWFEKFIPFLQDDLMLIGNSLGGIFVAKYLSENELPRKIKAVFLLAGPFSDKAGEYTLGDFKLPDSLENFEKQAGKIFLYNSKDDPVVPFDDQAKYAAKLLSAKKVIFEDKGHFSLSEFPELVEKLRSLK